VRRHTNEKLDYFRNAIVGDSFARAAAGQQTADNNFTLTESNGSTYQLEGDSSKLKQHVGHEIQVSGTIGQSAASSSTSPPKDSPSTIQVVDVKHLSSSCKSNK